MRSASLETEAKNTNFSQSRAENQAYKNVCSSFRFCQNQSPGSSNEISFFFTVKVGMLKMKNIVAQFFLIVFKFIKVIFYKV